MNGRWSGGKGSVKRIATPTDKQATAKELGCTYCDHYFFPKKECTKPEGVKCPKKS